MATLIPHPPDLFRFANPKARTRHRFGSRIVQSALPTLPAAIWSVYADIVTINLGRVGAPPDTEWCHHWQDGDGIVVSMARQGSSYWVRSPDVADFLLAVELTRHITDHLASLPAKD